MEVWKSAVLAVLLAATLCQGASDACQSYSCSTVPYQNDTCIYFANNTNTLYPCSGSKSYCPLVFSGQFSQCALPPVPSAPPQPHVGEKCDAARICLAGNCTEGRCTGLKAGASCETHSVCDVGLRCRRGQCDRLMEIGQWGCLSDLECDVRSGCNLIQGRFNGVCTLYFSLEAGSEVTDCKAGRSNLCQSSYCQAENAHFFPRFYCISAPVSDSALPVKCAKDAECTGTSRPWSYKGVCSCGYNSKAEAYCSLFEGDSPGVTLMESRRKLINSAGNTTCHTERRLTDECFQLLNAELAAEFSVQKVYFEHFPALQGNDKCVQSIFTSYYWSVSAAFWATLATLSLLL